MAVPPRFLMHHFSKIFLFLAGWMVPAFLFSQSNVMMEIQSAQNFLRTGQFVKSLEVCNLAIQKAPYNAQLYLIRGYCKYSLDDYIGAEHDYSRAIDIAPYRSELFLSRAEVRSQQKNFGGALDDLVNAVKLDSTNSDIYFSMAKIKLYLKKYFAAMSDCNRAINLGFKQEGIYILRGSCELELKRYDNAMADFKKAIEINPSYPYGYVQMGSVWMEQEKPDSALPWYNKVIAIDTANVYALFARSLTLIKLKQQKAALEDLNRVIRLSPYNSYAWFNRAIIYNEMKDYKKTIRDFDNVIRLNPKNITSYYYRGLIKAEHHDFTGALADLDKTIELYPANAEAWYERHQVKLSLNDKAGALKDLKTAQELAGKNKLNPDSLTSAKKNYMESLVKLSGDFEEMNDPAGKFQNQPVEIQLTGLFYYFPAKKDFSLIRLYDTYQKPHYPANIIALTNRNDLMGDSLSGKLIDRFTLNIDSSRSLRSSLTDRGTCYAFSRKFNQAFADLNAAIAMDSMSVLPYFSRATTRYDLIQLIHSVDDFSREISIGNKKSGIKEQFETKEMEHTYENVLKDLDRAIALDPEFPYAYYDRGFIHGKMGNYQKALADFSKAIELKNGFAEAYYNRGLIRILLDDRPDGCEDLSHAGELGITDAYKVMKRYCFK